MSKVSHSGVKKNIFLRIVITKIKKKKKNLERRYLARKFSFFYRNSAYPEISFPLSPLFVGRTSIDSLIFMIKFYILKNLMNQPISKPDEIRKNFAPF